MLISDTDYLIHTLRLAYLRNVDDPYGARIITLNPRYAANPYIRAAGLADSERWPEINIPSSPQPIIPELPSSANGYAEAGPSNPHGSGRQAMHQPAEQPGVWPGATGLKYTQTIYGNRKGGAGMRVSGTTSTGPRQSGVSSLTTADTRLHRIRSDSAPTPVSASPSAGVAVQVTSESPGGTLGSSLLTPGKRRSSGGSTIMGKSMELTDSSRADSGKVSIPFVHATKPTTSTTNYPAVPSSAVSSAISPDGQDPARPPLPSFALRFARGAEMEARRRERMRARFEGATQRAAQSENPPHGPGRSAIALEDDSDDEDFPKRAGPAPAPLPQGSAIVSSDEDDDMPRADGRVDGGRIVESGSEESSSDDGLLVDDLDDVEGEEVHEDDEFDGDFLSAQFGTRPMMTSTVSDDNSLMSSVSALSTSHSSAFTSSLQVMPNVRNRSRLSPVSEAHGERREGSESISESKPPSDTTEGPSAQLQAPVPRRIKKSYFSVSPPQKPVDAARTANTNATSDTTKVDTVPAKDAVTTTLQHIEVPAGVTLTSERKARPSFGSRPSEPSFTRQKVVPLSSRPPPKSALSSILAAQTAIPDNPFTELYVAIAARAGVPSVSLRVYFPHSGQASIKPLELKVRRDATVEEVIGFGLWAYWDGGIEPKLDEGFKDENDPKRETRLSAIGWNLRIAEDDGEIDEDFPALDRTRPISKFSFDDFGICEATVTQVDQNRSLEGKIVRRPSRLTIAKKSRPEVPIIGGGGANLAPPGAPAGGSSSLTSSDVLTSSALTGLAAPSGMVAAQGPPIFLRVRVATTADMHYSTTINVTADTYMADVLERVCRRRRLENPKEWALVTGDMRIVIPLDRTVASLAGKSEHVLVKRSLLDQLGLGTDKRLGRSSDPNASIFKRFSEVPPQAGMDFTAAYKKFTVLRKLPMLVGRHERTLAIDGDYIHIMPAGTKGLLDSIKTSSYHIKSVVYCKQSKKAPTTAVKLIVWRDGGNKRYDFDAEDGKKAAEIVSTIKNLQKSYSLERTGTVKQSTKPRRPRPLG